MLTPALIQDGELSNSASWLGNSVRGSVSEKTAAPDMKVSTCHMVDVKKYNGICRCELHEGNAVLWLALAIIRAPFKVETDGTVRKSGEEGICLVVVCEVEQSGASGAVPPGILWEEMGCV